MHGTGRFLFQANYSLAGEVNTTDTQAVASSRASLQLSLFDVNSHVIDMHEKSTLSTGNQPFKENGILSGAVNVIDGERGELRVDYSLYVAGNAVGPVPNPVPLPAAFWLFGSALAGIATLRRYHRPAKCTG